MVEYGRVKSTVRPETIVIDEFSVWENTDIQEVSERSGTDEEFIGFEYTMVQFSKDEFILREAAANAALAKQVDDTQLALVEVYEMIIG